MMVLAIALVKVFLNSKKTSNSIINHPFKLSLQVSRDVSRSLPPVTRCHSYSTRSNHVVALKLKLLCRNLQTFLGLLIWWFLRCWRLERTYVRMKVQPFLEGYVPQEWWLKPYHFIYIYIWSLQVPLHMVDVPVQKERGVKGTESRWDGLSIFPKKNKSWCWGLALKQRVSNCW